MLHTFTNMVLIIIDLFHTNKFHDENIMCHLTLKANLHFFSLNLIRMAESNPLR